MLTPSFFVLKIWVVLRTCCWFSSIVTWSRDSLLGTLVSTKGGVGVCFRPKWLSAFYLWLACRTPPGVLLAAAVAGFGGLGILVVESIAIFERDRAEPTESAAASNSLWWAGFFASVKSSATRLRLLLFRSSTSESVSFFLLSGVWKPRCSALDFLLSFLIALGRGDRFVTTLGKKF